MYNIFWKRAGEKELPRTELEGVWRVEADGTYDINPRQTAPGSVAIRTEKGAGILMDSRGNTYLLEAGTLIFLDMASIRRYHTAGEAWSFCWFQFHTELETEKGILYRIPFSAEEGEQIRSCCRDLASPERSLLAQGEFLRLLLSWQVPDQPRDLVGLLEQDRPIPEIAREAGMCERSFRTEIRRLTGLSPTEYRTRMKMDTAMQLLRTTDKTLQEISDSLGYANPFYFSRVFRNYFGITPGQARKHFPAR